MTISKVCVKLENSFSSRIVFRDYPLAILLAHSNLANRDLKEINKSGELIIRTTDSLTEPITDGLSIVLRWLQSGFAHNAGDSSQLTWELAGTLARRARFGSQPLSFAQALRVQEALHRIDLSVAVAHQYRLKLQLTWHIMSASIQPDDFVALFHLFSDIDSEFTDFAMSQVAERVWCGPHWPQMDRLWYAVTCDQRLYQRMITCYNQVYAKQLDEDWNSIN